MTELTLKCATCETEETVYFGGLSVPGGISGQAEDAGWLANDARDGVIWCSAACKAIQTGQVVFEVGYSDAGDLTLHCGGRPVLLPPQADVSIALERNPYHEGVKQSWRMNLQVSAPHVLMTTTEEAGIMKRKLAIKMDRDDLAEELAKEPGVAAHILASLALEAHSMAIAPVAADAVPIRSDKMRAALFFYEMAVAMDPRSDNAKSMIRSAFQMD